MREVKVIWVDSKFYSHEWLTPEEASAIEVGQCETKGYLVFKDKTRIVIAQTRNIDCETVHNLMVIPKGCIVEIKEG